MNHHAAFLTFSTIFIPAGTATGPDVLSLAGWAVAILFLIGAILAWLRGSKASARVNEVERELARAASRLEEFDGLKDALEHEKASASQLRIERASMEAQIAEREKAMQDMLREKERAMQDMKVRMENDFRSIASSMLSETHETFLKRANETFERHQEATKAEAEEKRKAVDDLVRPMKESLLRYEDGLKELRQHTATAQGELSNHIRVLASSAGEIKSEASKLATALRSGSKTRGNWGEQTLRNLVEMMGMSSYVDFTEQRYLQDEGKTKLPDMVVSLPGARVIAVDSKVSLNSYIEASEQTDETQRKLYLSKHADEIWTHVRTLSAKDYAEALRKEHSLDFVIMFLPGEHFFAAAMEMRPNLFQEAFDRKILIATPTTLIAIMKSIAYGWRQEKATENAEEVAALASDLYKAMQTMGNRLNQLGKSLAQTVKKYNDTVATIEGRVMPKARKFTELEMQGAQMPIEEIEQVEQSVRQLAANRDMLLDFDGEDESRD
ncbi:DNA recombination protein RmuC [Aquisalinus flavus]|uniref:DNA recombination protein RmuC homolog n=1 Tax=Aquisalinus flavus TaxID=1526572 RepID=A0A8J2V571_9PROT|nr:DNA recombination protein RmuC [Aquisalinus flavus]MBD0425302.1 DNA recombination protein RmuC [Aquisalinus flavus]UNE49045.1 DNA recombination protein RmuC [Aquisalinus flavus]GGD17145.1 hypothetical protein GCM10011342_27420 [Aquisalinus flavus]